MTWCQDATIIKLLQSCLQLASCCQSAAITKLLQLCCYAAPISKLLPLCWEAAAVILAVIGEEEFVKVLSRVVTVRWREFFLFRGPQRGGGEAIVLAFLPSLQPLNFILHLYCNGANICLCLLYSTYICATNLLVRFKALAQDCNVY